MVKSRDYVAKTALDMATGDLFGFVCGQANSDCSSITTNGTTRAYGAFSMCSANERLSWIFNMVSKICRFIYHSDTNKYLVLLHKRQELSVVQLYR